MRIFKMQKGFTLIELLVVIAVIAVLAVAVLSSINPVEQINKAKDTASKSDAAEYLNAIERFYATFGCYPWNYTVATGLCAAATQFNAGAATLIGVAPVTTTISTILKTQNEIKPEFVSRVNKQTAAGSNTLYVSSSAPADVNGYLAHICFLPSSATFKGKAKLTSNGTGTGTYYCVPGSD